MIKEKVQVSKGAMQLVDDTCSATVKFLESDGAKTPQLEMTAYSGGIIKGHWYWGDLAIDLEGMSFPKKKFPLLEDHDTSKKIGYIKKLSIENNQLTVVEATFLDTSQGFPYEASIYARPSQIQQLQENETADVNGFTMKGPGTIWRKSIFKESSVCTFGYDSNTKSAAMAEAEELTIDYSEHLGSKTNFTEEEEGKNMDYLKFKQEHPEEAKKFAAEVEAAIAVKFAAEKAELEAKLAASADENSKLTAAQEGTVARLAALEKAECIRAEQNLKYSADAIFADKFKEAQLPDRLSAKIRSLVSHDKFVANGTLDTDAFGNAVDAELKDWADSGVSVMGFSTSSKSNDEPNSADKLSADTASRMLKHIQ